MQYGKCQCPSTAAPVRGNFPSGFVVGAASAGLPRLLRLHRLLDVGRVSSDVHYRRRRKKMRLLVQRQWRGLFVAVFLAGNLWIFPARHFWRATGLVAGVADFYAGVFRIVGAGRFSFYLLLLS